MNVEAPIKRCDIVQLKEGGPLMVVCEVKSPVRVRCVWVEDEDRFFADGFHPRALIKVDATIGDALGLAELT